MFFKNITLSYFLEEVAVEVIVLELADFVGDRLVAVLLVHFLVVVAGGPVGLGAVHRRNIRFQVLRDAHVLYRRFCLGRVATIGNMA